MISGRQVVCLSSVPWGFLPTSRHHLARLFAEQNQVLFVDPPGNLLRFGRDEPSQTGRLVGSGGWGRLYLEEDNLHRLAPARRLPYGGTLRFRLATPINQRAYARSIGKAAAHLGFNGPVLWDVTMVYLATRVAEILHPSVHFVHMTDDLWSYPWYRSEYDDFLRRELSTAHFAVGTTPEIASRLAEFGVDAHVVGHGVDVERFASDAELPAPAAVSGLARPIVGFAGNIEGRVDVDLVERLAQRNGTVVLIGPVSLGTPERDRLDAAGVVFTGPVSFEELPAYLGVLDVGIVPYRSTELVRRSRPLKLLEMLAAGLPVVCTDLPAARELHPVVRVAATAEEFLAAVTDEWEHPSTDRDERVRFALAHSWRVRAEELSSLIVDVRRAGTSA